MALKNAQGIVVGPKFPLQHLTLHKNSSAMVFYGALKKRYARRVEIGYISNLSAAELAQFRSLLLGYAARADTRG